MKLSDIQLNLIGPIVVLLAWWGINRLGVFPTSLFPDIIGTFAKLYSIIISGEIFPDLWATFYRAFIGLVAASLTGIPLGILVGSYAKLYKSFEVVIDFCRSLPATAVFPLFLMIFGIGSASKIAIAVFISLWVVLINSAYGVIYSSKTRAKVAKSFGATGAQVFRDVTIMEALPQIFVGVRTAISLSLIVVVVSEMFIGSNVGLGQRIYDSYLTYETVNLYAWLLVTGFLGYLLNIVFVAFEKRMVHWVGR